jgi:uncharacterized membrane protein YgcG
LKGDNPYFNQEIETMKQIPLMIILAALLSLPAGMTLADSHDPDRDMEQSKDQDRDRDRDNDDDPDRDRDRDREREQIYGSELMTQKERLEHRTQMRNARTLKEREQIRMEHHQRMQKRAMELGITLPDEPPGWGMGMGSGGMGSGKGGMGSGSGGSGSGSGGSGSGSGGSGSGGGSGN